MVGTDSLRASLTRRNDTYSPVSIALKPWRTAETTSPVVAPSFLCKCQAFQHWYTYIVVPCSSVDDLRDFRNHRGQAQVKSYSHYSSEYKTWSVRRKASKSESSVADTAATTRSLSCQYLSSSFFPFFSKVV